VSPAFGSRLEGGINVIGFATGQFGVGEDARMATRVLLNAGLQPCVYEPPIPLAVAHRQGGWIEQHMQKAPTYAVNFITLPAVDTLRLFFLQQADVLAGRYNICGWQWELPKWPQRWRGLLSIPDEIWAQSRYLQKMFSESTEKPVTYIPSAVDIPAFEDRPRSDFGIPPGPFAFLSVFDCNGWYQRKNPLAAVRAFKAAFGPSNRDVQLIVKMMNSRSEAPVHQELMQLASQDSRILIIDRFLSRSDMLALLNCADVFVSLHRSEGFGRVVAECMLMGKPVISTNYSGSLDFAHEGTAYVVNGPMIPLQKGDYADHEGQSWMDPDIGETAEAMRRCVEDRLGTAEMALRGQAFLQTHHSIDAVAKLYKKRLDQLGVF
jgi:glycosyltransferase involved in cell wall biosynthesis